MGILMSKLMRLVFANEEHKVILVGLDNAGKTTILYQFLMGEVVDTSPTIGSNVEEVVWGKTHFVMWDIGGQESLRLSWSTYFSHSSFLILVIDSTDRERLHLSKSELYKILAHEDMGKVAVLILANKQDCEGSLTAAQISEELNLTSLQHHRWQIQACCGLTGEGLQQALQWMASNINR